MWMSISNIICALELEESTLLLAYCAKLMNLRCCEDYKICYIPR